MTERVRILLDGGRARLVASYMGGETARFREYRAAIDGATFHRARGCNYAPLSLLPAIVRKLRNGGFTIDPEDAIVKALGGEKLQWVDRHEVDDRIALIQDDMRERIGRVLRPYQLPAVEWLAQRMNALLADEQRLGKTITAIVAVPARAPFLVICPAGARQVWAEEIRQTRPSMSVHIVEDAGSFRWPAPGECVIASYERIHKIHNEEGEGGARKCEGLLPAKKCPGCERRRVETEQPCPGCRPRLSFSATRAGLKYEGHLPGCTGHAFREVLAHSSVCASNEYILPPERCRGCHPILAKAPAGVVVVVDEAHWIKNPESRRTQYTRAMMRAARNVGGRNWELTGTPYERNPGELWEVLEAADLGREAFGDWHKFVFSFGGRYLGAKRGYDWSMGPTAECAKRLQNVMMRRLRSEVWAHLPAKDYLTIKVKVDASTIRSCEEALASIANAGKTIEEAAELLAADEVAFPQISKARLVLATAKIGAMMERVAIHEEGKSPCIVFSCHRAPIEALGKRKGWGVIMGGEGGFDETVRKFQAGELRGVGIVFGSGSGGVGINLSRARVVVFVDRDYRPTVNAQAEDRGIGHDDDAGLQVESLVGDHVLDDRLTEVLIERQNTITASIDAARRRVAGVVVDGDRRKPSGHAEVEALERLRTGALASTEDERDAADLVEQADAIGLTQEQWSHVLDVGSRALPAALEEIAS